MISYKFKSIGFLLLCAAMVLTVVYAVNRVDFTIPVFAIHSSYLETKYFSVIENNFFEEIMIICYLTGFLLTAFSKEKNETDAMCKLRGEAWGQAIVWNTFLLIFFTLFVFGQGYMMVLIINFGSVFVFFHLIFWLKRRWFMKKPA